MNRYAHIDAMRAFAVLLVVFSHAGLTFVPGGSGVTMFFAISGFIITYLILRERDKTAGFDVTGFYVRRLLKIAPTLILVVVIPTVIYRFFFNGAVDTWDFLGQIFFFFNFRYLDSHITVLPGTHVMWSLSIEEQFYLVFALIWILLVKSKNYRKYLTALGVGIILYSSVARMVLHSAGASADRIYFGTDTRVESIAIGMLTALWYHKYIDSEMVRGKKADSTVHYLARNFFAGRTVPLLGHNWVLFTAVGVYILSLVIRNELFRDTIRYSMQAWAAAFIMLWGLVAARQPLGARLHRALAWRPLQIIGLASYSIYLVHDVLSKIIEPHLEALPLYAQVPILVTVGLVAGCLIYWIVEIPVQRFKERYFGARWKQTSEVPATQALSRRELRAREGNKAMFAKNQGGAQH